MRAMRIVRFGVVVLAMVSVSGFAAKPPETSWGKANVSIDDYRRDSFECAKSGYFTDVRDTQQAKDAIHAIEAVDRDLNTGEVTVDSIERRALRNRALRPNKRMDEVGSYLGDVVTRCLTTRGYRQFTLTRAQAKALGKLPRGSATRQEYLYSLASNPRVVAEQSIPS